MFSVSQTSDTEPLVCREILGDRDAEPFAGRRVDTVGVAAADASKRRLRVASEAGLDLAIDLPRGSFLRDGAVIADDGTTIVVIVRSAEEVMRVTISRKLDSDTRVAAALRIGHAFGNHHVPAEVVGDELVVPITTSPEIAKRTLDLLGLQGVEARFEQRPLALSRPLSGHAHHDDTRGEDHSH